MKKKAISIWILIICIIILLLGVMGVIFLKMEKEEKDNTSTILNQEIEAFNSSYKKILEEDNFGYLLLELKDSLGIVAIESDVNTGNYVIKKGEDLLKSTFNRQLFVMEKIASDSNNYGNFVILDMNGEVDIEGVDPTMDGTIAYYPYDLFKDVYAKYFEESFSLENRKLSTFNNKYDKDSNYIYYDNRRSGRNGIGIIDVTDISVDMVGIDQYEASVILHYSDNLAQMLGVDKEKAYFSYHKDSDKHVKLDSYIFK